MYEFMTRSVFQIVRQVNLFLLSFLLSISCQEWTPEADGRYVIDGNTYKVHVMVIYPSVYPMPSNNNIEVTLQGPSGYNVVFRVTVPGNTLAETTYHISNGIEPLGINYIQLLYGAGNEIISDPDSEGTMTVGITDKNYVLNFEGEIAGHSIEIFYSGLVATQLF
jgi:hypothetical protein